MKITLLVVGKTEESYLKEGIEVYEKRMKHYLPFEINIVPNLKNSRNMSILQQQEQEGKLILKEISSSDMLILLDEKGKQFSSIEFSKFIQHNRITTKNIVFVVGGAYGFSEELYQRANHKIALSKMTFSHQMVRLFFVEQLYRAMTILKGEPYHHGEL